MGVDVGLIGGTGIGERLAAFGGSALHVPTPFGLARGRLIDLGGASVFVVRRHSRGHKTPPHRVPYLAMAHALHRLGAKACFSTAAVGSLHEDWPVGTLAVCTDMLDLSARRATMFEREVRHTDFSMPFAASGHLAEAAGDQARKECVYVCMDGPRYETPFEISLLQSLGGDVVGMTAATEAVAMREAGVPYACLAVVTNLGCGLQEQVLDHRHVGDAMDKQGDTVVSILKRAIEVALRG